MLSQSAAIGISVAVALVAALASMPLSKTPPPDENTSVAVETMTHTVRTIPISRLPATTVVAPLVLPDPVPQAPAELAQHIMPVAPPVHTDVCRRHGGYKEVRGRSWHCVYPGKR